MKSFRNPKCLLAAALLALIPAAWISAQQGEPPRAIPGTPANVTDPGAAPVQKPGPEDPSRVVPGLPPTNANDPFAAPAQKPGTGDPFRKAGGAPVPIAAEVREQPDAVEAEFPRQVSVLVEYIQVTLAEANRLVRENAGKRDVSEMRKELDAAIEKGTAELIESSYILTKSGQRAKSESINEIIYPTEYDPGQIPATLSINSVNLSGDAERAIKTAPGPTAFEMRPVGTTIEVDPVSGADSKSIDLNIAPEMVEYLGVTRASGEAPWFKELSVVTQPNFYSMKFQTSVNLLDGETLLLGLHTPNPEKSPDKRVLVLVRADLVK